VLEFKNVSKIYAGGKKAVDNLYLHINAGEFIVFIGPLYGMARTCFIASKQKSSSKKITISKYSSMNYLLYYEEI